MEMEKVLKLPIGIENFERLRTEGFYYVDKTGLIKELLDNWREVNLFTRSRRFGKSLNMSMLRHFFEYGDNESLFDGLDAFCVGMRRRWKNSLTTCTRPSASVTQARKEQKVNFYYGILLGLLRHGEAFQYGVRGRVL